MTFVLVPLAKENLHTSSDLPLNFDETVAFTENITKEHGVKFDFSHFDRYEERGKDTWHFQIVHNEGKREILMREAQKRHHHEVALEYIKNDKQYVIEDN
jgi:hypothetical protein